MAGVMAATPAAAERSPPSPGPLLQLARQCVARHDTGHPLFHGCVDWHSAVHGHWALLWGARATGDKSLLDWVSGRLTPARLGHELEDFRPLLARGDDFELPYGRAWFLHLAQEMERAFGDGRALPLAAPLYDSLLAHARRQGGDPLATDYDNTSWALLHLARWARFQHRDGDWREIRALALQRLEPLTGFPSFSRISGFFDPAALAVLLLEEVEGWESPVWGRIRAMWGRESLQPVAPPFHPPHVAGLNYSRAWGLAAMYRRERDPRLLTAWHDHMAMMAETLPEWGVDYRRHGHWVAQFGLFALAMPPRGLPEVTRRGEVRGTEGK